jgi:hypothetical protein
MTFVNYAVYIALPLGEDAAPIVEAASEVDLPGHGFSVRENGEPNAANDGELFFRVNDVSVPQEALAGALLVYAAAREAAGLRRDGRAEPSLEPVARAV